MQPPLMMAPIGNAGASLAKFCQLRKASDNAWSPVGMPPLPTTTRAKRSGCSPSSRSPIRLPQSWQTRVMPVRSRASNSAARIQATCRA